MIAVIYFVMTGWQRLDNLGRKKRSASDTMIENILTHLSKVAVEHEMDDKGGNRFYLATKNVVEEDE